MREGKTLGLGVTGSGFNQVAEAPWSGAEWAVALRVDHTRATVLLLLVLTAVVK